MADPLPLSLISAFILFFGFLNTHQRHAARFQGASQVYLMGLNVSMLAGSVVGIGLLIYYGMQTSWYWPIGLFLIGSLTGGLLFGWLDVIFGLLGMSMAAFLGWPISAYFMYSIIDGLHP